MRPRPAVRSAPEWEIGNPGRGQTRADGLGTPGLLGTPTGTRLLRPGVQSATETGPGNRVWTSLCLPLASRPSPQQDPETIYIPPLRFQLL